jgi:hypothetical protein
LDAYCHWDKHGHRVDKPTWLRKHVRVSGVDGRETAALARKGTSLAPVDWLAHTADGIAPDSWNIARHWRTTYPLAFDDLRRPKFCTREHDYFALLYGKFGLPPKPYPESQPTKCRAPKKKDGPKSNIYVHCLYLARRARKQPEFVRCRPKRLLLNRASGSKPYGGDFGLRACTRAAVPI